MVWWAFQNGRGEDIIELLNVLLNLYCLCDMNATKSTQLDIILIVLLYLKGLETENKMNEYTLCLRRSLSVLSCWGNPPSL